MRKGGIPESDMRDDSDDGDACVTPRSAETTGFICQLSIPSTKQDTRFQVSRNDDDASNLGWISEYDLAIHQRPHLALLMLFINGTTHRSPNISRH